MRVSDSETLFKVVPAEQLSSSATTVRDRLGEAPGGDRYVTHLIRLQHIEVTGALEYLRKAKLLDAKRTSAVEVPEVNALLVSDFEPQLAKLTEVLRRIDVPQPAVTTRFFALKEERADRLVALLQRMLAPRQAGPRRGRAVGTMPLALESHAPSNTIIARGTAEQLAEVQAFVERLDRPPVTSRQRVAYRRLRHTKAKEVAELLAKVITQPPFADGDKGDPISLVADERANALVITAGRVSQRLLAELLAQLDQARAQILLEVAIVEFSPSDSLSLGVELAALDDTTSENLRGLAASSFGLSALVDRAGDVIAPGSPGRAVGRVPVPGTGLNGYLVKALGENRNRLPLVLRALQQRTSTNVLSLPRVLAIDGVPAEIKVADETPVIQTNALNTATTTTSFQEFVPAGTSLKFTASLSDRKTVALDIEQVVEAFVGTAPSPGVPPAKTSRTLKTTVRVPDGRIAILGGFSVGREIETVESVPLLGDIPLLGFLFRNTVRSVSRSYLYIFVQPRIIAAGDVEQLIDVSRQVQDEQRRRVPTVDVGGEGASR